MTSPAVDIGHQNENQELFFRVVSGVSFKVTYCTIKNSYYTFKFSSVIS